MPDAVALTPRCCSSSQPLVMMATLWLPALLNKQTGHRPYYAESVLATSRKFLLHEQVAYAPEESNELLLPAEQGTQLPCKPSYAPPLPWEG
jgi:hypothetical protein